MSLTHLDRLEAEALHVMREVAAEAERPVLLYSVGKDSSVLLHLALKAFHPAAPPFPLLHVATGWDFRELLAFRDRRAAELGLRLVVHTNAAGERAGVGPFTHGATYADVMLTEALKQALDAHRFDVAIGGGRRDEEKSRAKERIFSFRAQIIRTLTRRKRRMARELLPPGEFLEVHVDVTLAEAERRDPKGLYAKARRGELRNFTGIDSPYEPPEAPELRIDTVDEPPDMAAERIVDLLERSARGE